MTKFAKRLYEQFHPHHYDLSLYPDRDNLKFTGEVTITGHKAGPPSKRLTFHQKGLKVSVVSVVKHDKKGDQEITIDRVNCMDGQSEVRLHSAQQIYPGKYTVKLKFTGKITSSMVGIYASNFTHDGQAKKLIATQFESHHAREAFPCIDEPEAKATFQLSLTVPKNEVALSNTPVESERDEAGLSIIKFEPTPKMSTYLLAFVYGEMHCLEAKTNDGVLVRSWSSLAVDKSFLQYSVDEAVRVLEFFTDYFGVPYPLPKCDQVALPDFDAGAMENWGLITYREVALLADSKNRSVSGEQYVSLVVAHELSHQWFGNLVTMKWWDDLWLNESFASHMEHLALDAIHPEWRQWEHYTASDVISTSSRDIYSDVQPVSVTVTDPELIETLFDPGIVYAKGGRLLKMLREYIGDKAFQDGLKIYFKKHAYGNATRDDLWAALSETSGQNLIELMDPWIVNAGMPVLEVTQKDTELTVSQHRFLLDDYQDDQIWPVPLLADQKLTPDVLRAQQATIAAEASNYTLLNQTGSGHYFVRYTEPEHRAFLNQKLQAREIPAEARINILNDAFMLSRSGQAPLTQGLDTIIGCRNEDRDSVWAAISRIVGATSQLTEGNKAAEANLKKLRSNLARELFDKLGWDDDINDDANTKQLRHTILAYMISSEDPQVLAEANKRYDEVKDLQDLPAELRSTILSSAVKHGDKTVIDRLLKAYPNSVADVQLDITSALGSTKDPKIAEHIYSQALGPKGFVRDQDVMRWLAVFIRNHYVREYVWSYIVSEWDWLQSTLGASKSFDYLPVYCASVLNTPTWQKKYQQFFEPKKSIKMLERNILVGMADISARVAWRQREEAALVTWLADNTKA